MRSTASVISNKRNDLKILQFTRKQITLCSSVIMYQSLIGIYLHICLTEQVSVHVTEKCVRASVELLCCEHQQQHNMFTV